jgi:hypothetical protein
VDGKGSWVRWLHSRFSAARVRPSSEPHMPGDAPNPAMPAAISYASNYKSGCPASADRQTADRKGPRLASASPGAVNGSPYAEQRRADAINQHAPSLQQSGTDAQRPGAGGESSERFGSGLPDQEQGAQPPSQQGGLDGQVSALWSQLLNWYRGRGMIRRGDEVMIRHLPPRV